MADRDLLNKLLNTQAPANQPPVPARAPADRLGKLGVKERPREIGREQGAEPFGVPTKARPGEDLAGDSAAAALVAPPPAAKAAPKAFRAAYFNADVQATAQVNPRTKPQQALRGGESAMDLKRVVLPPPAQASAPSDPEALGATLSRMLPVGPGDTSLASLVGRQNEWSQLPTVRPEHIAARQRYFAALVAFRRDMLARMRALGARAKAASATIGHAMAVGGAGLDTPAAEVEERGDALIAENERHASPMRSRLQKVTKSKIA